MSKTKLTLYVDKEISEKAKRISKITGKSISGIVSDFIYKQDLNLKNTTNHMVSEKVEKWIGVSNTKAVKPDESYKELRDKMYEEKLKKYENTD